MKNQEETNLEMWDSGVHRYCRPMEEWPGSFPFTRGIKKDMYRGRLWTMRQYAGYSSAKESNERYHYLLAQGTTGLSVAFDLPTQIGYDSDDPYAEGEVGKVGVAIDTLQDMEDLFQGIDLSKVTVSMTINSTASILLALYIALAKKRGVPLSNLGGTVQNDILKEYAARGTYIYPPGPSLRLITDVFEYCSKHLPKWNTISVSGYHIREAGSTAVQELAFTLANGKAYLKAAQERGLEVNVFAKRMSFFFNCHNGFFQEVAKFRAARRMWAKVTRSLGATDPRAQQLRFHTQTAGSSLTAQQPKNNIVRVSLQALAAVLGGTQSLHTNGYDEAISLPSEEAVQLALRTQQIIAYESGVPEVVDPLGGSFYVENLTDKMEEEAWKYIEQIEELGGAVAAIEQGFIQQEIAYSSFEFQEQVDSGEKIMVGVNKFVEENDERPLPFTLNEEAQAVQLENLEKFKRARNASAVEEALTALASAAEGKENLMPKIIEAVEKSATLGEIANVFRRVFGEYQP